MFLSKFSLTLDIKLNKDAGRRGAKRRIFGQTAQLLSIIVFCRDDRHFGKGREQQIAGNGSCRVHFFILKILF
jgi:hypothetical protein